ncbi:MAG TPA: aminoacyl-tRNA hydrolase [Gemmatimonadota bacterium]|nr:aminoacyl-tRNA hydrolase [Gemmatimonadota bacterium]
MGLGNPRPEYEATRHNVGFRVVDRLARGSGLPGWTRKGEWLQTGGVIDGASATLVKPLTWMNASGRALVALGREVPFEPEELLVCYDELALPLGRIRLRASGSHGGHNGMRSIIEHLGTEKVPRLRVGIFPESGGTGDPTEFVLRPFRRREEPVIEEAIARAVDAVACAVAEGLTTAMNRFNPEPA